MKNRVSRLVCILSFLAFAVSAWAGQPLVTHIEHPNVKTLMVDPVTSSQGGIRERVCAYEFSFDELSNDVHLYSYTVTHLNANLEPSDLMSTEYLEGFTTSDITDYFNGLSTSVSYTHYSFTFPNEDMRITRKGLYAVTIYEDGDPTNVVAVATVPILSLCAVEGGDQGPQVSVSGSVTAQTAKEFSGRYQQLDMELSIDPATRSEDYFVVVRQNGRYDNLVYAPQPTYREPRRLRWVNCRELIFEGGNEYRHFDTYSTYYAGVGVDKIRYGHGANYYVTLDFDNMRNRGVYTHHYDVNGDRVVYAERCYVPDYEAEYMYVHFEYPAPLNSKLAQMASTSGLYVGGQLFYNRLTSENRMLYDPDSECFWLDALVKQGGSDYQYWCVTEDGRVTLEPTEGSYWQTENDYSIYVYYRPFGSRCDELISIEHIFSR